LRVLVIKIGSIGDVVHSLPTLEVLSRLSPKPEIHWVVGELAFPLLNGDPRIDRLILFRKDKVKRHLRSLKLASFIREVRELSVSLREVEFELLIDLQGDLKSALVSMLSRSEERISFCDASEGNPLFLKKVPCRRESVHVVERYLDTVRVSFRVKVDKAPFAKPFVSEEAKNRLSERFGWLLKERIVSLIPSSTWSSRTWFDERWEGLSLRLVDMGFKPVIIGGADAKRLNLPGAVNLAGELSLDETCALLERCSLSVGVDTGPTHLSASLGIPTVALFGPTPSWRNSPWGPRVKVIHHLVDCAPCRRRNCPKKECMRLISEEEVLKVIDELSSLAVQEG